MASLRTNLLAARIDHYAQKEPNRIYASVPKSDNLDDGFRDITYRDLARAINKACWWLDTRLLQVQDTSFPTFAYSGSRDLRYIALFIAGIKTGRKILLPSPTAPLEGLLKVFDATQCETFLCSTIAEFGSQFEQLYMKRPHVRQILVPDLIEWFNGIEGPEYVYEKSWAQAIDDPVAVLHTSGTTGLPKPVVYTNGVLAYFDTKFRLPVIDKRLSIHEFTGRRIYAAFPFCHLGGIAIHLLYPVYFGSVTVLAPPDKPFTAELTDQMIRCGNVSGAGLPPFLLEALTKSPAFLDNLRNLDIIRCGSAPLATAVGELIARDVHIQTEYGSTEMTFSPYYESDPEDWEYLSFHPYSGVEFVHRENNLFELLIVRKEELRDYQPVFKVLPQLHYFYTKDLFSPHPTKPNLWKFCERADDMIALSSGAKVHVKDMELAIQSNPLISAAVIGGDGRPQTVLLVEPLDLDAIGASQAREDFVDRIWSSFQKTNERWAKLGQLSRSLVVVASSKRPFPRLAKGSVDRRGTLQLYKDEVDALYSRVFAQTV